MLSTQKEVTCPYCQLKQSVRVEINDSQALLRGVERFTVIHCDEEQGGCEVPFVVQTNTRIDVIAEARAIESLALIKAVADKPLSFEIVEEQT